MIRAVLAVADGGSVFQGPSPASPLIRSNPGFSPASAMPRLGADNGDEESGLAEPPDGDVLDVDPTGRYICVRTALMSSPIFPFYYPYRKFIFNFLLNSTKRYWARVPSKLCKF